MRALLLALLLIDLGAAQTLQHEWDFGRGASPWLAAHGTTATASEQGLRVEVTGDDPYLHCAAGACLDLAASPGQFIRLKLRSSHAGTAEFFWAASSAGRDAGFVAGQEIAFPVAAGEWQEIDVYPGWQGRVTRLRFDPPGDAGAVIEVARIAVYEWPASSQAGPTWDLTRDHGGWLPRGGAQMSLDPEGLTIRGELPQLGRQLPAPPAAWLTLDGMAASAGQLVATWTDPAGQQRTARRAIAPGPFHRALPLTESGTRPAAGAELQLAFHPELAPGSLTLAAISLGETPAGPPRLDLLSAQFDRATAVGNEPVTLTVHVQNAGGAPLPAGLVPTSGELAVELAHPALTAGQQATLTAPVRRPQPWGGRLIVGQGEAAITLLLRAGGAPQADPPAGATVTPETAALVGPRLRLRAGAVSPGRYGPFRLEVPTGDSWRVVGSLDGPGDLELAPAPAQPLAGCSARVDGDALLLTATTPADPFTLTARYQFAGADTIAVTQVFTARRAVELRFLAGPWLRAGDGASGAAKREALFPGIEYLGGDVGQVEASSSARDIAPPGDLRAVPDRHNITIPLQAVQLAGGELVALWWPVDAQGRMPAAIFASPNFVEAGAGRAPRTTSRSGHNHLLGVFWPPVPEGTPENALRARQPLAVAAGETITIEATILARAQGEVLDAVDAWIGATRPAAAGRVAELLPATLRLSRTAYERVLWREGRGWVSHIAVDDAGWNPLVPTLYRYLARRLGEPELAATAIRRVPRSSELVLALHQGNLPAAFRSAAAQGTGALAARDANGRWTFQPDARRAVLGAAGETNVGIMAPQVAAILRAARAGADEALLAEGLKGLEQLRAHRIPRGAQVWEVPLHAPDILASAIACDAFTLGYTLTGDRRYLADADYWARTALPFIYHWQHPRPDLAPMRGGTIPVFGATFYTNSWFGRLVQWNGLALARALFQLQRAGGEARWARVAEDITVSAMRQQVADPQSPLVGLYPDFWNMRTGIPGYWMSPTPILARALEAVGETPEGDWRVIRNDGRLVTLAAPTPAANLRLNHEPMAACGEASGSFTLSFDLRYELGPAAYLGLSGVASPAAVRVDGTALPAGLGGGETAGWQHYPDQALLVLRLDHRQREQTAVVLEGLQAADPAAPPREWRFGSGPDGWDSDPHEVTAAWEQGRLILTATGDDPYVSGPPLALPATGIKQVVVRARVTSAGPLTIFFATDSGGYSEQQLLRTAPIPADGRWHEVSAEAAGHPRWTGQLRRLRLDPPGSRGAVTEIAAIALR